MSPFGKNYQWRNTMRFLAESGQSAPSRGTMGAVTTKRPRQCVNTVIPGPDHYQGVAMHDPTCLIHECGNPVKAAGYCNKHYKRVKSHGDPHIVKSPQRGTCVTDGCDEPHMARGWCGTHYSRWRHTGSTEKIAALIIECSIDECEKTVHAQGWCNKHYKRWRKYGDPMHTVIATADQNRIERVLANTVRDGDCLRWQGAVEQGSGYARITVDGKSIPAHRYVHEQTIGPIPEGYEVDHVKTRGCKHRDCINPDHLEAVTPAENIYRTDSPIAINRRKTHCHRGHPLEGENLILPSNGQRTCRRCILDYRREKVQCEFCGKSISRPNIAAHRKRCSAELITSEGCA